MVTYSVFKTFKAKSKINARENVKTNDFAPILVNAQLRTNYYI